MRPEQHVTLSLGSGVILWLLMQSWIAGVSCCLAGILIDLDHGFEFWLNRGFSLSLNEFLDFIYNGTSTKFYDAFHAYEYTFLLLWIATIPGFRELGWGLTAGYLLHLAADQCFNIHLNKWTYFLTYRVMVRFDSSRIVLSRPCNVPSPVAKAGRGLFR